MIGPSNGRSIKKRFDERGFSLVEVMVTIAVSSILIAILATSFPGLNRMANSLLQMGVFAEQNLIFLMRFEEEFQLAQGFDTSEKVDLDAMKFRQDLNSDGDFDDSGEFIAYRWNEAEHRVDRKSGNGYYQAMVDGIAYFHWSRKSEIPLCYQMEMKSVFSETLRTISYCR